MEYLVTGRQAKAIDTYTIEHTGIPSLVLMERASLTIAEETAQVTASLPPEFFTAEDMMSRFSSQAEEKRCHRIVRNSCLLPRICQSRSAMTRTLTHII